MGARQLVVNAQGKDGREILPVPTDGSPARKLEGDLRPSMALENFLPAVSAAK